MPAGAHGLNHATQCCTGYKITTDNAILSSVLFTRAKQNAKCYHYYMQTQ